jgi:hypothetical protein
MKTRKRPATVMPPDNAQSELECEADAVVPALETPGAMVVRLRVPEPPGATDVDAHVIPTGNVPPQLSAIEPLKPRID